MQRSLFNKSLGKYLYFFFIELCLKNVISFIIYAFMLNVLICLNNFHDKSILSTFYNTTIFEPSHIYGLLMSNC